uniref:Transcription initiation factor TFIID component TAF4 C-terminal domain-containing protein n=1 Tax=Spongospora subterranea TaxID=70186 RepID=A0A0H5QKX5_9EUKA|eukprot:CRZ01991.1 hypothetical protein [Spongospora subterranea]
MDIIDESDSESSDSAAVALNYISNPNVGEQRIVTNPYMIERMATNPVTGERLHPALQAQINRNQHRSGNTLSAVHHGATAIPLSHPENYSSSMLPSHVPQQQGPSTAPTADETNVYDPFAAAGLDLQRERQNLNALNEAAAAESRRFLSARQVMEEQFFVRQLQLKTLLLSIAKKRGLVGVSDGVCETVTFALQEHLEDVIEQLVAISKKRTDEQKPQLPFEVISEPHQIVKRIQKAEETEKRRLQHEEHLRILIEAKAFREARGNEEELDSKTAERLRSVEDAEKERQKLTDINDAALLAIGGGTEFSFKKKTATTTPTTVAQIPLQTSFLPASALSTRDASVSRCLCLQDCIHYLERDYHSTKSNLLFKLYHRVGVNRLRR